jgi:periplasmic copper chaperone A
MTDLQVPPGPSGPPEQEAVRGPAPRRWGPASVVVAVVAVSAVAILLTFLAASHQDDTPGTTRVTATNAAVGATDASAAAAYLRLTNGGAADDRLVKVTSPEVGDVTMHVTGHEGGLSTMRAVDEIVLPAGGTVVLRPGGSHLMLTGAKRDLRAGETITLHLQFEASPAVDVRAAVVPLADLAERVGP